MTDREPTQDIDCRGVACLFWDLAGTLVAVPGGHASLPGCAEFLPQLARDFQLIVTTGEGTGSARDWLRRAELLDYFEEICGGLLGGAAGKPYGEILERRGARPECSLAVGDRLTADVPADTDRLVTVLINQGERTANAGMVAYLIDLLRQQSPSFPAAFRKLAADAQPEPSPFATVHQAWRREDGLTYRLWIYRNPLLDGDRLVIVL